MKNKHIFILQNKIFLIKKNIYDITFGNGGFISNYKNKIIIAIDKKISSFYILKNYNKNFFFFNQKITNFSKILKRFNFFFCNILLYDEGFSSCQIKNNLYYLKKNEYKKLLKKYFKDIFFNIIKYCKRKFIIIIINFSIYNYYKLFFFLKKIKKFNLLKNYFNYFEISLNNGFKNSIVNIIYAKKTIKK